MTDPPIPAMAMPLRTRRAGLMAYRRDEPPRIVAATLGEDRPIAGATEEAWAALLATVA